MKQVMEGLFAYIGENDPIVQQYRQQLEAATT
jgi:thioredoxin-like negative regulator of GroEL